MNAGKTTVSILCPSYNHERFIGAFIDSVLGQSNPNWELVICDDGSDDGNAAVVERYTDSRIKLVRNPFNMGINCAINTAFEHSSGDIVALSASDDVLMPDFVDTIIREFSNRPDIGVIYCDLQLMDENAAVLPGRVLKNPRVDTNTILRVLFMHENCLLSPGMSMRRHVFERVWPLAIPVAHNHDYKIHVDLLLHANACVLDYVSLKYRRPSARSGLSLTTPRSIRARKMEEDILMDSFLQIKTVDRLRSIFGDGLLKSFGDMEDRFVEYYLGMLALMSEHKYKQIWGYNRVVNFLKSHENYMALNEKYGFTYRDFLNLVDNFKPGRSYIKYIKYKRLFNFAAAMFFALALITVLLGMR